MKIYLKKHRCYLIVISLVLVALSMLMYQKDFYLKKLDDELEKAQKKSLVEYAQKQEEQKAAQEKKLLAFYESMDEQMYENTKSRLKSDIEFAHSIAQNIVQKYNKKKSKAEIKERIQEAILLLNKSSLNSKIFLSDLSGNRLLELDEDTQNTQYRDIDLEMLQTVSRDKEGFIEYTNLQNETKILYVKELGVYEYFIGMTLNLQTQKHEKKEKIEALLKKIAISDKICR